MNIKRMFTIIGAFSAGILLATLIWAVITLATLPAEAQASERVVDRPITPLFEADGTGPPLVGPGKEYVVFYEKDLDMDSVDARGDDYYMDIGDEGLMVVAVALTRTEHAEAHRLGIPHAHPADQPGKLLVDHFRIERG